MLSTEDLEVSTYKSPDECVLFQCEKQGYADFVQDPNEALKCQSEKLSMTYIFKKKKDGTPVGYLTLAMGALRRERLPEKKQRCEAFSECSQFAVGSTGARRETQGGRSWEHYGRLGAENS